MTRQESRPQYSTGATRSWSQPALSGQGLDVAATRRKRGVLYWLPPYCPSLNLIERLWGHLKRTVLANVLYATLSDLVAAFRKGARRLTGNRERMGFMFDHDDVVQKSPQKQYKIAA